METDIENNAYGKIENQSSQNTPTLLSRKPLLKYPKAFRKLDTYKIFNPI